MKKIKYIVTAFYVLLFLACTDNFEEFNTNPYEEVSEESLKQDFNHIGAFYAPMFANVLVNQAGQQVAQNLCSDSWVRYLASPTPFVGGVNNTTYHMTWKNSYWDRVYKDVMAPAHNIIKIAEADGFVIFEEWANLVKVLAISRLTTYHGPLIYSNYGTRGQVVHYDSEEELYNILFSDLDRIHAAFTADIDNADLKKFDASYQGDLKQWIKVINTLRLRLAIRISKIKPDLAKTQGEKAISDEGGLIMSNSDNFNISLYGGNHPLNTICFGWNDTRMSATMESILVGYKDDRISKYFEPVSDLSLVSDHPELPYKGIRNGALLDAKGNRTSFSSISESFKTAEHQTYIAAAETNFLLAEAKLRGWQAGSKSVQEYYEDGVKASFALWGAGGVDAYLQDDISIPIDYNDPKAEGDVNDFVNRINITIKWDEAATQEEKLERIITQKWIAGYPNSFEPWADHRRTGYPLLPFNYKNDSYENDGIIAADDFIKRMKFVPAEYLDNLEGVNKAIETLSNGKDEIGTRLWWDVDEPNF